jgi:hypothetical protein
MLTSFQTITGGEDLSMTAGLEEGARIDLAQEESSSGFFAGGGGGGGVDLDGSGDHSRNPLGDRTMSSDRLRASLVAASWDSSLGRAETSAFFAASSRASSSVTAADDSGGGTAGQAATQPSLWSRGGPMRVGLSLDCMMQVSVASTCERYLRVWLEKVAPPPRSGEAAGVESGGGGGSEAISSLSRADAVASQSLSEDSVVLPPGDSTPLKCFLQTSPPVGKGGTGIPRHHQEVADGASARHTTTEAAHTRSLATKRDPGGGPVATAAVLPEEPDRLAAAEAVCGAWAVCWRMIGLEDDVPHGSIQLSEVDVARVSFSVRPGVWEGERAWLTESFSSTLARWRGSVVH